MIIKYKSNNIKLVYKGNSIKKYLNIDKGNTPVLPDIPVLPGKPVYNPVIPQEPITDNVNEIPYIITYHYEPTMDVNKDVIIPLYFTDYRQREYLYDDVDFYNFKLRVQVDDNEPFYIENLKAGDYDLNLGKLSKGEHHFNVEVTDQFNRTSCRLFKLFKLVDPIEYEIKPSETYTITASDLSKYSIKNNNSQIVEDMINCRVGLTNLFTEIRAKGYRKCILPKGIYRVNRAHYDSTGREGCMRLPSGLTVDMNESTFKLHPFDDREYGDIGTVRNAIVCMHDCIDTHLINGTVEGDFEERFNLTWEDNTNAIENGNGEHDHAIFINGGRHNSITNVKVTQVTGYNLCTGFGNIISEYIDDINPEDGLLEAIGIDDNGNEYRDENLCSTTLKNVTNFINKGLNKRYISLSVILMYGLPRGNHWDYKMSFYDENRNFIESFNVQQFRTCRIPLNAKYIRTTFKARKEEIDPWVIQYHNRPAADYLTLRDMEFVDNRTCVAPFQFMHLTMDNINFTRSGQSITPIAIDLEDGWEQSQDFYLRNCTIKEQAGTGDLVVCAGLNIQMENCTNFRAEFRYRINGLTVRNNKNLLFENSFGWMTGNTIRAYNNKNMTFGYLEGTDHIRDQLILLKNNSYKNIIMLPTVAEGPESMYRMSGTKFIDSFASGYGDIRNGEIYITKDKSYIGGGKYYNCNFYTDDSNTKTFNCSFTDYNAQRYFYDCAFHSPCIIQEDDVWLQSTMDRCVFKKDVEMYAHLIYTEVSDITFNDCIFEGNLVLEAARGHKIIFNNCTLKGKVTYLWGCEDNIIWNN